MVFIGIIHSGVFALLCDVKTDEYPVQFALKMLVNIAVGPLQRPMKYSCRRALLWDGFNRRYD